MIRLTALLAAAALAVPLGTPLLAQEPQRGGVAERPERPAAEERARGEGPGGQRRPEAAPASRKLPPDSITQHTLELPGRTLRFTATAGSLPARRSGRPAAGRDRRHLLHPRRRRARHAPGHLRRSTAGRARPRPISISCVLGPWRLPLDGPSISPSAAPRSCPNAETWLDFTDLVFIDPVDTGYSRAVGSARGHPQPLLQHRGRRRHAVGGDHALAAGRTTA